MAITKPQACWRRRGYRRRRPEWELQRDINRGIRAVLKLSGLSAPRS
jgi:hypothetical protein